MANLGRDPELQVRSLLGAGVFVGLSFGAAIVASLWEPNVAIWYFWAPLAMVLAAGAGAAPAAGLAAVNRLKELGPMRIGRLLKSTAWVVLATLIVVNLSWFFPDSSSINQNGLLISWTVIAGSPMALAMLGVRQLVSSSTDGGAGDQVELLLSLRRLARSLVLGGGTLTALVTLQGGAVMDLQRQIDPLYNRPQQYVLVIGMVGTLLVGGLYVVTHAALQDRALALVSRLSSVAGLQDAESIEKTLERRKTLLEALEADRTLFSDLQANLIVLAPLIASAAAVTLPRSG